MSALPDAIGSALSANVDAGGQAPIEGVAPVPGGAPTAASAPAVLAAGVPMQEMIESIHATIQIAARGGIAQARIALQPEEFGHISIHLSQTSDGLLARVSAATPAAAQALADGRSELHRTLSSLGVTLLRLDIGSSGQSEAREREDRFAGSPTGSGASSDSGSSEDGEAAARIGVVEGVASPVGAPRGELVDVLA
jgi:flagellar hook-length control protein FliK